MEHPFSLKKKKRNVKSARSSMCLYQVSENLDVASYIQSKSTKSHSYLVVESTGFNQGLWDICLCIA